MTRENYRRGVDGLRGGLDTLVNARLMTDEDPFWVYCQDEVRALVAAHDMTEEHRAWVLDLLGLA